MLEEDFDTQEGALAHLSRHAGAFFSLAISLSPDRNQPNGQVHAQWL